MGGEWQSILLGRDFLVAKIPHQKNTLPVSTHFYFICNSPTAVVLRWDAVGAVTVSVCSRSHGGAGPERAAQHETAPTHFRLIQTLMQETP